MENIDEESPMELAICLSVNWLLLWLRFAKQAKLFLEWCVCGWALAFTIRGGLWFLLQPLTSCLLPRLHTESRSFLDLGESGGHWTLPPPPTTHTDSKKPRIQEKRRGDQLINLTMLTTCGGVLFATPQGGVGGEGGHGPLQSCKMQNIPHHHPRNNFYPSLSS